MATYLRPKDAARYLGIGKNTLNKLRMTAGAGPAFRKLGPRIVLYSVDDLDAWADAHRRGLASDVTTETYAPSAGRAA
jgi:predicted DNA-binding transcriptional regulator AlpA